MIGISSIKFKYIWIIYFNLELRATDELMELIEFNSWRWRLKAEAGIYRIS